MPHKRPESRRAYMREYERQNREQRQAYQRKWRSENPDKVKAYQETYWRKKLGFLTGQVEGG